MRRFALALTALIACAGREKLPAKAPAPERPPVAVPPGFEPRPGEERTGLDLDGDGRPDVWRSFAKDGAGRPLLLRAEKDLNGDGRVETWEKYAPDGRLSEALYDLDLDGSPDEGFFYEGGRLVRKELAVGFGGVPRTRSFYEDGRLVRKERDTDGDSRVDAWEYWEDGTLDRIGIDGDGDGKVDRWEARRPPAAEGPAGKGAEPGPAAAPPSSPR